MPRTANRIDLSYDFFCVPCSNKPLVVQNCDKTHQLTWDCLDMTQFHRILLMMPSLPLVL